MPRMHLSWESKVSEQPRTSSAGAGKPVIPRTPGPRRLRLLYLRSSEHSECRSSHSSEVSNPAPSRVFILNISIAARKAVTLRVRTLWCKSAPQECLAPLPQSVLERLTLAPCCRSL